MRRFAAALAAFLLLPVLAAAQTAAPPLDGRLKKIRDAQSIGVAYRTDAIPFSFEDTARQPTGYTVDLCRRIVGALEKQLGLAELKIRWVPVTTANRFEAVAKGQADMECGSSTVTLGRMKEVDFSSFTFVDGTGLLVRDSVAANGLGDLVGRRIGVIAGTSNEKALKDALQARVVNATVVPVKSRDEGLAQLEAGAIDAFASDRVLLIGLGGKAKDPKSLVLLTEALSFEPYGIALPRGDWQMRLAVNTALAQIFRSGAIGEIYGRWFGALGRPGEVLQTVYLMGAIPE